MPLTYVQLWPLRRGGLTGYCNKVAELLGLKDMDEGVTGDRNDDDYDSDVEIPGDAPPPGVDRPADGVKALDPTKRAFWRHLNLNFRGQKNWMLQGDGMAVGFEFNLAGARRRLADSLRAGRASAAESIMRWGGASSKSVLIRALERRLVSNS